MTRLTLRSFTRWIGPMAVLLAGIALAQPGPTETLYRDGQDALADGRFSDAVEAFRALGDQPGAAVDRALYWQAYAESKAGRRSAALSTLTRLVEQFPASRWLDDARALQLELGGLSPERVAVEADDELKLYALDALMHGDPERAVELLEAFLAGDQPKRLQEHALFVLSQTSSPRAGELLTTFARDGSKKDLQREAIRALAISGESAAITELTSIYRASNDVETKHEVLQSLVAASAPDATLELARAETDRALRSRAIETLAAMGATEQLSTLERTLGPEHRSEIYRAYGIAGDSETLLRALGQARDPQTTTAVIEALGIAGVDPEIRERLLEAYRRGNETVKDSVLHALVVAEDSGALLEVFRSEADPERKGAALRSLSIVGGPEVDSLIEQLVEQ